MLEFDGVECWVHGCQFCYSLCFFEYLVYIMIKLIFKMYLFKE